MKNKTLFLFFLTLLFLIPFMSATPYQVASISDAVTGTDGVVHTYMNNYFSGYDTIQVQYEDDLLASTVNLFRSMGNTSICNTGIVKLCLIPTSNNIDVEITSLGNNYSGNFYISAYSGGTTTGANATTIMYVTSSSSSTVTPNEQLTGSTSFIGALVGLTMLLFPDYETLTMSARFGYVAVTLLIISFLILFLAYKTAGEVNPMILTVIFIIDVAVVFYFISIHYIPLAFLIIVALVLIALAWLKARSGG